jgi:hypothetical protein
MDFVYLMVVVVVVIEMVFDLHYRNQYELLYKKNEFSIVEKNIEGTLDVKNFQDQDYQQLLMFVLFPS